MSWRMNWFGPHYSTEPDCRAFLYKSEWDHPPISGKIKDKGICELEWVSLYMCVTATDCYICKVLGGASLFLFHTV